MATSIAPVLQKNGSRESDYGSDFSLGEEDIVNELLEDLKNKTTSSPLVQGHKQQNVPGLYSRSESACTGEAKSPTIKRGQHSPPPDGVQYPDLGLSPPDTEPEAIPTPKSRPAHPSKDSRSPLQHFRSFPRKPLSVSDLASGAWCELQYWYTLTLLPGGRKTETAAMRGGTRVHQTLEDQVHTAVQVSITSKEEAFALRLWNVIQGLRTLRDTGMTRELEVWGIIEGEIVNGIIDELSHESPNPAFEEELSLSQPFEGFPASQPKQQASIMGDLLKTDRKKVYLTDIKTRGSDRLPTGAALRPARVQLFLYHRLLGEMASGVVDFAAILGRYGLSPEALFSDAFMAQVGDLQDEVFYDADSDLEPAPSIREHSIETTGASPKRSAQTTPPPDLIRYRSIAQILPLLRSELRHTFPQGAATLGNLVAVQYRHRDDGRIIGNNSFPNDPEALDTYMSQILKWWRGERDADGVSIEETYKCRSCEFAADCQWRKDKETEFLQKKRKSILCYERVINK
ncbi:hypothetical protein AAE478_001421 [Parahypoxylon ruwenzoriense]